MQPTEPHSNLLKRLNELGWHVTKNDFQNNQFVVQAEGPGKQKASRVGSTLEQAVASILTHAMRVQNMRSAVHRMDLNYNWQPQIDKTLLDRPITKTASVADSLDMQSALKFAKELASHEKTDKFIINALRFAAIAHYGDDIQNFNRLKYADKNINEQELEELLGHPKSAEILAKISSSSQTLIEAAFEDLSKNGRGFVFRATASMHNIPSAISSTAWMLINPLGSDLAVGSRRLAGAFDCIDSHHKLERVVLCAKAHSGYSHLPTGLYSLALAGSGDPNLYHVFKTAKLITSNINNNSWWPNFSFLSQHFTAICRDFDRIVLETPDPVDMIVPFKVSNLSKKKEDKLKKKLAQKNINKDEDARVFGYFAAVQVDVSLADFKDFMEEMDDKYTKKHPQTWKDFKKKSIQACKRWSVNKPVSII